MTGKMLPGKIQSPTYKFNEPKNQPVTSQALRDNQMYVITLKQKSGANPSSVKDDDWKLSKTASIS